MPPTVPRRVAVTGMGALCSLGDDVEEIWQSIGAYRLGYRYAPLEKAKVGARFFGTLETVPNYKPIPKSIDKFLPEFARLGFITAKQALAMAFGERSAHDYYGSLECGVIFGTGWGGTDYIAEFAEDFLGTGLSSPFSCMKGMHNVGTAAISMHWKLRGYQNTPVAACAASSIAVGDAFELIRSGRARMMLAGGAESLKGDASIWSADVLQALSKEKSELRRACCPFSADRSGFIMSEGAGAVCLEDMESAQARGATILAEIVGYGNYSDAFDMTAPAPDLEARVACIERACRQAGIAPQAVDYINAHGTSTPLNDLNETECIKRFFGPHAPRIPVSSTKSYTGHLMGAAGVMESIFCVKTLQTGLIPATANLDRPDPACDLDYVPNRHRHDRALDVALNLNYGFGGSNSALLFRKYDGA
ncbi:MAG: beta-ketoacyl-[acyl-carrier-protein] synthase family protein [Rhodocyclales bacterium]|nr:beta-ketoacyl-[acyl-carrier-protein] synthase family protein [Rhodocyclales bacterium]